jgi:hypothetical protein
VLNTNSLYCDNIQRSQNIFGTSKILSACWNTNKGFYIFDYETRATNAGLTYELASGHPTTKSGFSVGPIHGSTTIIADHDDNRSELYVGDFSITTGTFPKFFVTTSRYSGDLNYIESTVLIIATGFNAPYSVEIHDTS